MQMPSQRDPDLLAQSTANPDKRTRRIAICLSREERELLLRRAAARGMKLAPYLRAAGLGMRTHTCAYTELAREVLAIGHAVIQATPETGADRERLLFLVRPVLSRIGDHLP